MRYVKAGLADILMRLQILAPFLIVTAVVMVCIGIPYFIVKLDGLLSFWTGLAIFFIVAGILKIYSWIRELPVSEKNVAEEGGKLPMANILQFPSDLTAYKYQTMSEDEE